MEISVLAGRPAPKNLLVDLARLEQEYYERLPLGSTVGCVRLWS